MIRKLLSAWLLSVVLMTASAMCMQLARSADALQAKPSGLVPAETENRRLAGDVNLKRLRESDSEPGQWLANGRDLGGSYFSPLKQINTQNVSKLGYVWEFKTGTYRGMEATPLVIDGVLYVSGIWGAVYAMDAANGRPFGHSIRIVTRVMRDGLGKTSSIAVSLCGTAKCTSLRRTAAFLR